MKVTVEDSTGKKVTVEDDAAKAAADWDGSHVGGQVVKAEDESRYTLTVAYPANRPDVAVAQDGHRDFASKGAVEKAAWSYLANSPKVGLMHQDGTEGAGQVVESYIYRGEDWTVAGTVVKEGDWMLGVQWGPEAWAMIQDGRVRGMSMQGSARRAVPSAEAIAGLRS